MKMLTENQQKNGTSTFYTIYNPICVEFYVNLDPNIQYYILVLIFKSYYLTRKMIMRQFKSVNKNISIMGGWIYM